MPIVNSVPPDAISLHFRGPNGCGVTHCKPQSWYGTARNVWSVVLFKGPDSCVCVFTEEGKDALGRPRVCDNSTWPFACVCVLFVSDLEYRSQFCPNLIQSQQAYCISRPNPTGVCAAFFQYDSRSTQRETCRSLLQVLKRPLYLFDVVIFWTAIMPISLNYLA